MQPGIDDTAPEVREMLDEAIRRMSPQEKLQRVADLNQSLAELALARLIRDCGPQMSERERRLRLAALRLPRQTMVEVFDWDPEIHGY